MIHCCLKVDLKGISGSGIRDPGSDKTAFHEGTGDIEALNLLNPSLSASLEHMYDENFVITEPANLLSMAQWCHIIIELGQHWLR